MPKELLDQHLITQPTNTSLKALRNYCKGVGIIVLISNILCWVGGWAFYKATWGGARAVAVISELQYVGSAVAFLACPILIHYSLVVGVFYGFKLLPTFQVPASLLQLVINKKAVLTRVYVIYLGTITLFFLLLISYFVIGAICSFLIDYEDFQDYNGLLRRGKVVALGLFYFLLVLGMLYIDLSKLYQHYKKELFSKKEATSHGTN